jgi:hypothetical protein
MPPIKLDPRQAVSTGRSTGPSQEPTQVNAEPLYDTLSTKAGFDTLFAPEDRPPFTAPQFEEKFKNPIHIGSITTLTVAEGSMTDRTLSPASAQSSLAVYRIALEGPSSQATTRSFFPFRSQSSAEWRKVGLELSVGSDQCPDWDHANVCLTAIQDLIKLADGCVTDEVVKALKTHMNIVSYECASI